MDENLAYLRFENLNSNNLNNDEINKLYRGCWEFSKDNLIICNIESAGRFFSAAVFPHQLLHTGSCTSYSDRISGHEFSVFLSAAGNSLLYFCWFGYDQRGDFQEIM